MQYFSILYITSQTVGIRYTVMRFADLDASETSTYIYRIRSFDTIDPNYNLINIISYKEKYSNPNIENMKKSLKISIFIALSGTIFSLTYCSKSEPQTVEIVQQLSSKKMKAIPIVFAVAEKVPSRSYGLKVRAKESIERLYKSPKDLDKMTEILKREESARIEKNRKTASSNSSVPNVKSITFTATDYGTYYVCYAEAI